ncbi:MAG: hypothetical protein AAFR62_06310 [Cyanobacteria bacterium J06629_2]
MGKSSRPHQASDPQPLSRQSPFGTLVLRTVRCKAQGNARDWGLGESSPNMDL